MIAMNNYAELTTTEKRKALHDLIDKIDSDSLLVHLILYAKRLCEKW